MVMSFKLILEAHARQIPRFAFKQLQSTRCFHQSNGILKNKAALKPTPFNSVYTRSNSTLCKNDYERISDETLDALSDFFEDLEQDQPVSEEFDIVFEGGVLTIVASKNIGTYVINKQAPNKQIWLSSPISGPKRYDFHENSWMYLHDKTYLYKLLENEFSEFFNSKIDMSRLPYYKSAEKL